MKKGVSLYFVIVILSVITVTLLSLITISVGQIKVVWGVSDSIIGFYAADTGTEQALFRIRKQADYNDFSGSVNGVGYSVEISTSTNTVVKSIGTFKDKMRAIEITF